MYSDRMLSPPRSKCWKRSCSIDRLPLNPSVVVSFGECAPSSAETRGTPQPTDGLRGSSRYYTEKEDDMKQKRKRKTRADIAQENTEAKLKDVVVNFLQYQREQVVDNRDKIMLGAAVEIVSKCDAHELSQYINTAVQTSFVERQTMPANKKEAFPPGGGQVMSFNAGEEGSVTIPGSPIAGDPLTGEA
jgi:hypothetical protein